MLAHLAARGFTDVDEVVTANERLTFSLPQELKRDMKAAAAARGLTGGNGGRSRCVRSQV